MPLRIPEEDIPALAVIKALPEASARALADALKSAKPSSDTSEMAARISKKGSLHSDRAIGVNP